MEQRDNHGYSLAYSDMVHQCKSLQPAIDQFLNCSSKLHTAVQSTIASLFSSLESLQNIAGIAADSKGHCSDVAECLHSLHSVHRQMGADLGCVERTFANQLVSPLQLRNRQFRKNVATLEKKHLRETKKMKESIKKKKEQISRLRKKVQKDSSTNLTNLLEQSTRQLYSQYMELTDKEQEAVKMMSQQKRSHLCAVIACVKPVVEEEVKMLKKAELMSDIIAVIDKVIRDDSNYTLSNKHNAINMLEKIEEDDTPSTPTQSCRGSVMGSRAGSIMSLASFTDTSSCYNKENASEKINHPTKIKSRNLLGNSELEIARACPSPSFYSEDGRDNPGTREPRSYTFSTVKRAHSPFRKLLHQEKNKVKDFPRQPERQRPSRPPLPPRSPYIEDDSLHDLQLKLRDISALGTAGPANSQSHTTCLPPLPPRSAYVEDDSLRELQDKLLYLAKPSSLPQDVKYPSLPTVTATDMVEPYPDCLENIERVTHYDNDTKLVEIVELPDEPPLPPPNTSTIHYPEPEVPDIVNAYNDVEAGLVNVPSVPHSIPHPPHLFSQHHMSHLPSHHHIPNAHLKLLPPHLPLLPITSPVSLLSPQHPHHRRAQSLYSAVQGPSLADQILSDSDMTGINWSLSFGVSGLSGVRGSHFFQESRGMGGAVRTNIDEHIEILNQHKCSIMNLMKEDFH